MMNADIETAETILYVEDEKFVREVTREILESAGFCVRCAKNTVEALQIFEEERTEIGLLLSDMVLPGETGRQLAARIHKQNPWLRVLYVSGYPEQVRMLEDAGEDYLAKPFSSEALLERIRGLLHESALEIQSEVIMPACAAV